MSKADFWLCALTITTMILAFEVIILLSGAPYWAVALMAVAPVFSTALCMSMIGKPTPNQALKTEEKTNG